MSFQFLLFDVFVCFKIISFLFISFFFFSENYCIYIYCFFRIIYLTWDKKHIYLSAIKIESKWETVILKKMIMYTYTHTQKM